MFPFLLLSHSFIFIIALHRISFGDAALCVFLFLLPNRKEKKRKRKREKKNEE